MKKKLSNQTTKKSITKRDSGTNAEVMRMKGYEIAELLNCDASRDGKSLPDSAEDDYTKRQTRHVGSTAHFGEIVAELVGVVSEM